MNIFLFDVIHLTLCIVCVGGCLNNICFLLLLLLNSRQKLTLLCLYSNIYEDEQVFRNDSITAEPNIVEIKFGTILYPFFYAVADPRHQ